ncbi:MAG: hypothetical protein SF053_21990 [Bacteroidia bacterium]|nr:hypothetical protein [Bacteroidia bacterium]
MNAFFEKWNEELEDLKIHLSLGEEELAEAFDKQKARFQVYADQLKQKLDEAGVDDALTSLRAKVEELQVQLALGKADSRDALEAQRHQLHKAVREAGEITQQLAAQAGEASQSWLKEFEEASSRFQTRLEVLKVQAALGEAELKDKWEESRRELDGFIHEAREKMSEVQEDTSEKLEEVSREVAASYEKIKAKVRGFFA